MSIMSSSKALVVVGAIIAVLGAIFHLQGQSVLGPESSFMHANPEWITYGIWIFVAGLSIACAGVVMVVIARMCARQR